MVTQRTHQRPRSMTSMLTIPTILTISSIVVLLLLNACTGATSQVPLVSASGGPSPQIDWKQVDQAMGKAGAKQPGGVYKYSFPRTDLDVILSDVSLKAPFALGTHVEFLPMGSRAMVMGDLVLTEDEVNGVITKLQQEGIEQTALHNHLFGETPRIMYLHIGGQGDPVKLARGIHGALAQTKTPLTTAASSGQPQPIDLDTKQLDATLKSHGKATSGVYQYSIPRAEKITADGMDIPPAMGTATAINFQPTGAGKAAITGDFVLLAREVNPVIKALREYGIEVTALHNHMLTENPRLFYLHFWGNDDASKLAQGLRAALDQTRSAQAR
ncbi:hypothetical protein KSC_022120 [Ktedonobacter sp. SOSP1-52]|uniref:DUF1259 domain-containing protein n=1 Tax=Ktedonobacter sp. SOSP1-52 TaxID=2778366 RepID=UPI001915CEF5|nr:DUF1259 domain-containing protein [Ktedonobacter sp. SOSP1-52]GHO63320.1 hypothetical protein KSC_022120 [Ktedonobacter sp. SOSP1-52]